MSTMVTITVNDDTTVTIPTTDEDILVVVPDYYGEVTLWQYAHAEDMYPVALLREGACHAVVWERTTAGVPRV